MAHTSHRSTWFRLLLIGLPFLAFGVLELAVRILAPQPPRGMSENLFTTRDGLWFLRPGATDITYGSEFSVHVTGDERGYREGLSVDPVPPDSAYWVFGDSFGFGWGVEADQAACGILAARGIPVANFCMPGEGIPQYARRMERSSLPPPRGILILLYDNDLSQFGTSDQPVPRANLLRVWNVKNQLMKLHVVRQVGRGLDALGVSRWKLLQLPHQGRILQVYSRELRIYRKDALASGNLADAMAALRSLLEAASRKAPEVWLVHVVAVYTAGGPLTQDSLTRLGEDPTAYDFEAVDRSLAALCRQVGCRFLRFAPTTGDEEERWYYEYDLHLTPEGQLALADRLQAALTESM